MLPIIAVNPVVTFFIPTQKLLTKSEIDILLKIDEPAGFAVNGTVLNFGTLPPGTSSFKTLNLTNGYSFPIKVKLSVIGNVSDFLVFENYYFLEEGEVKQVKIKTVEISKNDVYGNYSGNLIVEFFKPR